MDELLIDLSARLPYKTIVNVVTDNDKFRDEWDTVLIPVMLSDYQHKIIDIKPYLRPMSDMTEEERKEYWNFTSANNHCAAIDYLNTNHFDYRGLIPKNKAYVAEKDMYK